MNIKFTKTEVEQCCQDLEAYESQLASPIDSFLEEHIMESQMYHIQLEEKNIGTCGIHKGSLITFFYLKVPYRDKAQEIFAQVRMLDHVENAFVSTGDEFFLSHCMDNFMKVEKQAYFFQLRDYENIHESKVKVEKAGKGSKELVEKYHGGFFGNPDKDIEKELIYIARLDDEIIGFGAREDGVICKKNSSIGMYVRPEFRQKGLGTNILKAMQHLVHEEGYTPIAGCWYYNHNSKKTLQKSGFYSKTRLLKFFF